MKRNVGVLKSPNGLKMEINVWTEKQGWNKVKWWKRMEQVKLHIFLSGMVTPPRNHERLHPRFFLNYIKNTFKVTMIRYIDAVFAV